MKNIRLKNMTANDKIVFGNILGAFVVKGGALLVSLISTPIFIQYFNDQQVLGVWYTLLSVLSWFLNFDLGVGNGIRNNLVEAITKKDWQKAREVISSGITSSVFMTALLGAVGCLLIGFVDWNVALNISGDILPAQMLQKSVIIVFAAILLRFLLTTVNSIFYALQLSAVNNLLALCVSVLQLIFVLVLPRENPQQALVNVSWVYLLTANVPIVIAAIVLFLTKLKHCAPSHKCIRLSEMKSVLNIGSVFFICQIFYMLIVNTNEFLISYYFDPNCTTEYTFYYKITNILSMLVTLAITPIWSAVTKAMSENNWEWLGKLYRRMKLFALLAVCVCFLVVPFLQPIMDIWLGKNVLDVDYMTALSFAVFGGSFIYSSILSTIVCGMARMKLQAICYGIGTILKLLFILLLVRLFSNWDVVVWINALILIPYCLLQQIDLDRYFKKQKIRNYMQEDKNVII